METKLELLIYTTRLLTPKSIIKKLFNEFLFKVRIKKTLIMFPSGLCDDDIILADVIRRIASHLAPGNEVMLINLYIELQGFASLLPLTQVSIP